MTLSVVIPTWAFDDRRRKVCLASLDSFRSLTPGAEFLFIDNGSERPLPWCAYRFDENVGYANAVNKGLEMATGDFIAVGSADVIVTPGWSEPLRTGPEVVVRCPVEVEEPRHKVNYRGDFYGQLWVMPREVFEAVGYIDNTYQNYCDRDYAIRIRQAGYDIQRVSDSEVHHIEASGSWDAWDKKPEKRRFVAKYGANGYAEWVSKNA